MNEGNCLNKLCVVLLLVCLIVAASPIADLCGSIYPVAVAQESAVESAEQPEKKPNATRHLENSLAELDKTVYVYKDFSDGYNNFTQKAWIGDSVTNIPKMDEAAGHFTGVSGIAAELDLSKHLWGGYMFLNGSLAAGEIQPIPDFGGSDCGFDLVGATKLVFYAKGETGRESVEFFMGGLGWSGGYRIALYPDSTPKVSLGFVRLATEWKRYEIDLAGRDVSRIACGFGWVTNDLNNPGLTTVKFYMDDIHYEFPERRIAPMFLQSYASVEAGTEGATINNFAYLYDNALVAMALSYVGNNERAQQVADAIVYALERDRYYADDRLRNAYSSGDPRSFPGWYSGKGEEFARLPGFYDVADEAWYEDYFAVSSATGNLAWAAMALCEVYQNVPERTDYLDAARKIGDFILSLKDEKGGFTGGYEGWERSEVPICYKATEHNLDLITTYGLLAKLTGEPKYTDAAKHAKAFVLSMYDKEKHCFYTGTTADGVTQSRDVLPLDCNTWAILALGDEFKDGEKVMAFVEQNMRVGEGYDFNSGDKDGVWFEGTAQVALAYKEIGDTAKYEELLSYLNANALPDGSIYSADRDGVTTGFAVSGTNLLWSYSKRSHIGATAWLAYAQMGRNPFSVN